MIDVMGDDLTTCILSKYLHKQLFFSFFFFASSSSDNNSETIRWSKDHHLQSHSLINMSIESSLGLWGIVDSCAEMLRGSWNTFRTTSWRWYRWWWRQIPEISSKIFHYHLLQINRNSHQINNLLGNIGDPGGSCPISYRFLRSTRGDWPRLYRGGGSGLRWRLSTPLSTCGLGGWIGIVALSWTKKGLVDVCVGVLWTVDGLELTVGLPRSLSPRSPEARWSFI